MRRELGRWLEGPGLSSPAGTPGDRLGLPADGPGSMVGYGARFGGYVVDAVLANLLAGVPVLFGATYGDSTRGLVVLGIFLLEELVLVSLTGQTVGMRLFGFGVVKVPGGGRARFPFVLVRTLLLALLIPLFLVDRDMRGLHDRIAGTAPVKAARRA
ncbi:RDD family protein [Pseudofrankia asymbiotica]|nr:RDD family protein [Pseudofrankia asymbiotica]